MVADRWIICSVLLLVCLAITAAVDKRLMIIPHLYKSNLGSNARPATMDTPESGQKILIFAPHPDDETIGCAGYIQQALAAGAELRVALVTNGEYPEIDLPRLEEKLGLGRDACVRLGLMRQMESTSALGYLGLPSSNVIFLGYPNRYLDDMWLPAHWSSYTPVRSARTRSTCSQFANSMTGRAVFSGESALDDVEELLLREQPDIVLVTHPNDVHPDHWAAYGLVRFALNELAVRGEPFADTCRVYTYLVHRDWWPAPRQYRPTMRLEPPAALVATGQTEWQSLPLTEDQTQRKHDATGHYRTQAGRFDPLLRSFSRANELFGLIRRHEWPDRETVEPHVVVMNPDADLVTSAADKQGDISMVSLGRTEERMVAQVVTRGTASTKTAYHMSLHAGTKDADDRLVAQYDWQDGRISSSVCRNGRLSKLPYGSAKCTTDGNMSALEVPWPLDQDHDFFMIRVWTTRGKRLVDQTGIATFDIVPHK